MLLLAPGVGGTEIPPAGLAEALRQLGPPGLLWGRLAVEEESPEGAQTPLQGVDVAVYPAVPAVLAELGRIRQGTRSSGREYENALPRLQKFLATYQAQVEAASPASALPSSTLVRRQTTDPGGIFTFDDLPSGEWLVVAIRTTPYGHAATRSPGPPPPGPRRVTPGQERFLPRTGGSFRQAEVWLATVRIGPGQRLPLLLTDRGRWLVGPVP